MLFEKLKSKIRTLFNEFDNYLDTHIDTALQITTELKNLLSSPPADIAGILAPYNIDTTLRQQILDALSKAIEALNLAENRKQYTDTNGQLTCFIQQLKQLSPQLQDAVLLKLASLLTGFLHGKGLKQYLYDVYTQIKYSAEKAVKKQS